MVRVFLYVPIIPYHLVGCCPASLTAWASDLLRSGRFPLTLSKTIKKQAKCTRGAWPCFSLSRFCQVVPTATSRRMSCGRCPYVVSALRCESTTVGCVGLACLARCHARLHGSACLSLWLRPSRLSTWSPLVHPRLSCCSCSSQASDKASSAPQPCIASLRPIRLSVA